MLTDNSLIILLFLHNQLSDNIGHYLLTRLTLPQSSIENIDYHGILNFDPLFLFFLMDTKFKIIMSYLIDGLHILIFLMRSMRLCFFYIGIISVLLNGFIF